MDERAIFTAIPGGRVSAAAVGGVGLRVTVVVTPRLTVPAGQEPIGGSDAFRDWPRTVRGARWVFQVGNQAVEGFPLDDPVEPDDGLWDALFGATAVGQAGFQDYAPAVVHSYPVAEAVAAVTDLYAQVAATSPTAFPPVTSGPLADAVDQLGWTQRESDFGPAGPGRPRDRASLRNLLDRMREQHGYAAKALDIAQVPAAQRPGLSLALAKRFYDRSDDPWAQAATIAPPPPVAPELHSFVARLADFPELMRRTGLAVDLVVKDDPATPEHTRIRVLEVGDSEPLRTLATPDDARPWTALHYTDRFWAPELLRDEDVPDIEDGSLRLDDTGLFTLDQVDPDGASLKVWNLLLTAAATRRVLDEHAASGIDKPSTTPDAASVPALRSTGLVVARGRRAVRVARRFERAAGYESRRAANVAADLDAYDVTRGWRVDVQDPQAAGGGWFSLHRRAGEYVLLEPGKPDGPPLPVQPAPDEGYLKAATTTSSGPDPAQDQYLHEALVGWEGWSLAVQRPGKPLKEVESAPIDDDEAPRAADTGFPLAARFSVPPGTLPRLRFGRKYGLRVRAVDLSGWSVPEDQLDPQHERWLDAPYQRWEPVPAPAVVPRTEFTEGESLVRLVVRSTLGVPAADYVTLPRVRGLAGHEPSGRTGIVYRTENERHLAPPSTSVQLAETHGVLDAAFAGSPAQVAAQFALLGKESGSYLLLPGGRVVTRDGSPVALSGVKGENELADGQYVVHDVDRLALPYLPDPLTRGLSFTTLPGSAGTYLLPWPGAWAGDAAQWHDRLPVLLRVVEGSSAPAYDAGTRALTVSLPPATIARVRVSSFLDDADVELLRVWHLVATQPGHGTPDERTTVREGRHWMTTPWVDLTLVHAVEKPLEPPQVLVPNQAPGVLREAHETFSVLRGTVHNHAHSTGRLDVDAAWEEPVDDVTRPAPHTEQRSAHVADFSVLYDEPDARLGRDDGPPAGPYTTPLRRTRHEHGDLKHRWVTYRATATTRYREYFPPEVTGNRDLVTHEGPGTLVDVPSARRPDAPEVVYVVPQWTWTQEPVDAGGAFAVRRVRSGGGLRVYLARPWWSSGPDEELGVVVRHQPWLTHVDDLSRGVLGSAADAALADDWAKHALAEVGVEPDPAGPVTSQLLAQLDEAAAQALRASGPGLVSGLSVEATGGRLRLAPGEAVDAEGREVAAARVEPRTAAERVLAAAQAAVARAQGLERVPSLAAEGLGSLVGRFPFGPVTSPEARRFTTVWGADPVFRGAAVPDGPYVHQLPLRHSVGAVTLAEVPGGQVTVVGHQVEFDPERRLWFADLELTPGDAYTPFVRLWLSRYQPHSVPGEEISPVVKADFVQLLPRREATYTAVDGAVAVTVTGPVGVPEHATDEPTFAKRVAAGRRVEAWLERLPAGATSDLAWEAVGAVVPLAVGLLISVPFLASPYAHVRWVGGVPVPPAAPGERYRVRVAEYELHTRDAKGLLRVIRPYPPGPRLVYADEVELPAA